MAFSNATKSIALPLILTELEQQFNPAKEILFSSVNNPVQWYHEIRSIIRSFGNLHIRLLESSTKDDMETIVSACLEAYCKFVDGEQLVRRHLLTDSTESQKSPDGTDVAKIGRSTGKDRRVTMQHIKKYEEANEDEKKHIVEEVGGDNIEAATNQMHAYMKQSESHIMENLRTKAGKYLIIFIDV